MIMMKYLFLLVIILFEMPFNSFCQNALTIEINGLRNRKGQILVELSNEKEIKVKGISQVIIGNKCIITIEKLKSGKYAFKYFHDENSNSKLDKNWIGIPKEGFGFSNNAAGAFGPPSFEKTIFELINNVTVKCKPTYY